MSYENIRLKKSLYKSFASVDDYFVAAQPSVGYLIKKTNYGDPVMTYPYSYRYSTGAIPTYLYGGDSNVEGQSIYLDMQTDGMNYWTLEIPFSPSYFAEIVYSVAGVDFFTEEAPVPDYNTFRILHRWRIENFMFTLKDQTILHPNDNTGSCTIRTFAIEHYHDVLAQTTSSEFLKLNTPTACYFHSGDNVTIYNNATGNYIDRVVSSITDEYTVELTSTVGETVAAGSPVSHVKKMYTFNDDGSSSLVGTIEQRSISFYTGAESGILSSQICAGVDSCYESGLYKNIFAAHFCTTSGVSAINNGYHTGYIMYINGMQLFFKKPARQNPLIGLTYPDGSVGTNDEFTKNDISMMLYDLLNTTKTEIFTVYALSSSSTPGTEIAENIYRLQRKAHYGEEDTTFSDDTFNYVVSVTTPLVTAMTLVVEPAVLPADGLATTNIYATVTDQYGYPVNNQQVDFSVVEHYGGRFISGFGITPSDYSATAWTGTQGVGDGKVAVKWQVGSEAGFPTIAATVSQ